MARKSRANKQLKKKPTLEDDTSIFPCDIIPKILSRLPVKSLVRFKSVSKPWNSIISDVGFAKVHLLQSKNSDCCEARALGRSSVYNNIETHHLLKFTNQGIQSEGTLKFPLEQYITAPVLCSYDGLVLLKNTARSDRMFVIWNPSTRVYATFLSPYCFSDMFITFGICYDECSTDYKVLIMEDKQYAVFSYNNDAWTQKPYSSTNCSIFNNQFVVVHGVPHWVVEEKCEVVRLSERKQHRLELSRKRCNEFTGCTRKLDHFKNHPVYECNYHKTLEICYLDHRDDTVKKLRKPVCLDEISKFQLASLRSQLCLYRNTYDHTMMEIWMMKQYGNSDSWIKLLTIENIPRPHVCRQVQPLCFTSEGYVVIDFDGEEYAIYSPIMKNFRESEPQSYDDPNPLLYLETLVFPRRIQRWD